MRALFCVNCITNSPWARYENPPPPGDFWRQIFGHHVIWLFNICLFALKILGHKKYWVIKHMHPLDFNLVMLQEDGIWDEKNNNMGFNNICKNPLNPKIDILLATFTWKFSMKTLSTPLLKGEIFENTNFKTPYSISIQYLLVCTVEF